VTAISSPSAAPPAATSSISWWPPAAGGHGADRADDGRTLFVLIGAQPVAASIWKMLDQRPSVVSERAGLSMIGSAARRSATCSMAASLANPAVVS
jgi:hypothetical protein